MENNDQTLDPTIDQPLEEPHGDDQTATTDDQTDWKAMSRKWEKQAKENKDAAAELAALKEKVASLEAATQRAEEAEAKVAKLEADAARQRAVDAVAAETGIPATLLARMNGDTEEEIRSNAEVVRSTMPVYPTVQETGHAGAPQISKEQILSIQNERERLKAIAEHADLF